MIAPAPGDGHSDRRAGDVRPGVRLGLDVGSARIGVARSDPSATLAVPVETIDAGAGIPAAVARVGALVAEYEAMEVLVGHPVGLDGRPGRAAAAAQQFAEALGERISPTPVRLLDERLSTVQAQAHLHGAGRNSRTSRAVIDQAAAVVVLQHAIDSERALGRPAGHEIRGTS